MTSSCCRWRSLIAALLVLCVGVLAAGDAEPPPPKIDLGLDESVFAPEEVDPLDVPEAEKGDNQRFTFKTDSDISTLEVGDIYKAQDTYFQVVEIADQDVDGGSFTVTRIYGRAEPADVLHVHKGSGPSDIKRRRTVLGLYLKGGFFMHPIALCLLIVILLFFSNLWIYRRRLQMPPAFIDEAEGALEEGDLDRFGELAENRKGLFPSICRAMADRWRTSTVDDLRGRTEIEANRQIDRLRLPLRLLGLISTVAPLLGLLGTVTGMVICFDALAYSAASAAKSQQLADGIRVALFTTVFGLSTAIPAQVLSFFFGNRLNGFVAEGEEHAERFLHHIAVKQRLAKARKVEKRQADKVAPAPAEA